MKPLILAMILLSSLSASAIENKNSSADWVTEASTLLLKGQAAQDLYQSLNAPERLDPLSTNYDQYRTKTNKFAQCAVSFYRESAADGDVIWVIQNNAECKIKAPKGTAINQ